MKFEKLNALFKKDPKLALKYLLKVKYTIFGLFLWVAWKDENNICHGKYIHVKKDKLLKNNFEIIMRDYTIALIFFTKSEFIEAIE